jgi:beta-lactamase regulating signal transducer with metallopeptidase domain
MIAQVSDWLAGAFWARALGAVLDVSIKAAVVCTVGGLVTVVLRRSSAHARSMVWVFVLAMLLALPFARIAPPVWNLPVLPDVRGWFGNGAAGGAMAVPAEKSLEAIGELRAMGSEGSSPFASRSAARFAETWHAWALLALTTGAVLSLGWQLMRTAFGGRILRRCEGAGQGWVGLLEEASAGLCLHRRVRLFESSEIGAAVTIGAINPAIVVPAGSSAWPTEKRRCILAHELAHITRWDSRIEVLVSLVRSLYWFNPLVWLAARSLRIERERDCDDAVLNAGARPSDYALFLLDVATDLGRPRGPVWRLSTLSQSSNLKERIMCILDPKIDRTRGRRRTGIVSCLLVASIILPVSVSGIWQTQAQENYQSQKEKELKQKEMQLKKEKEMQLQKKMSLEKMSQEEKAKYEERKALKEKLASLGPEERIRVLWEQISGNKSSAAVLVHEAILKKGPEAGIKTAMKLRESGDEYYFKEGEFNTLGYLFLFDGKVDDAIAVFKLNVEMNPDSWNVYDSLGEGYLAAGDYDQARDYYKKSLELNPQNENGKMMLAKIEESKARAEHATQEHMSRDRHESREERAPRTGGR